MSTGDSQWHLAHRRHTRRASAGLEPTMFRSALGPISCNFWHYFSASDQIKIIRGGRGFIAAEHWCDRLTPQQSSCAARSAGLRCRKTIVLFMHTRTASIKPVFAAMRFKQNTESYRFRLGRARSSLRRFTGSKLNIFP